MNDHAGVRAPDRDPASVLLVDELRERRLKPIEPAGMSYERALEIAIAAIDNRVRPVNWFTASGRG